MLPARLYWTVFTALHMRGQARYPFRPVEAIRRDEARNVRRAVAYAYRHVPYYRETMTRLGLTPDDFRSADDLARLPVLERQQLQRDPERFLSDAVRLERCLRLRTSGSCGTPVEVHVDARSLLLDLARAERLRSMVVAHVGRRRDYREARIFSPRATTAATSNSCRARLLVPDWAAMRRLAIASWEPRESRVAQLNAFRPDVVFTSGSMLADLYAPPRAGEPRPHVPEVMLYGSDRLPDAARQHILGELDVAIYSTYQSVEAGWIAFECDQHVGLHQNLDSCPVRLVDAEGRTLPPGEMGEVVVSNLTNRATVVLNYRLGDLAAWLPDPCPCGRNLPLLSFPQGRCDDFLVLPSGQRLHPVIASNLFRRERQIWTYRVVQESPARFRIEIVPAEGSDRAALTARILAAFRETFGPDVVAEVRLVGAIERTALGKHRTIVRLAPDPVTGRPA